MLADLEELRLLAWGVVAVFPQWAVVTCPLLPLTMVVVGHQQHVVHVAAALVSSSAS